MQQLRLFCPYMRKDALCCVFIAEKKNYPCEIQGSHGRYFGVQSGEDCSFKKQPFYIELSKYIYYFSFCYILYIHIYSSYGMTSCHRGYDSYDDFRCAGIEKSQTV